MAAVLVVLVICLLIIAAVVVVGMGIHSRRQIREMEHRERLAMIERGLPPPVDLESIAVERSPSIEDAAMYARVLRWRTAGIVMIGLGLAYFFLVSFAVRNPEMGIGVGGAFTVIGAAFFVNALMLQKSARIPPRRAEPTAPSSTRDG